MTPSLPLIWLVAGPALFWLPLANASPPSDTGAFGLDHGVDEDGDSWPDEVDCDDSDPTIYPGAEDTPYDGIDSDCQWNDDFDMDEDGYVPAAYEGLGTHPDLQDAFGQLPSGDCNDDDPRIHPGMKDVRNNGVDENCNGLDATLCGGRNAGILLFGLPLARLRRRR